MEKSLVIEYRDLFGQLRERHTAPDEGCSIGRSYASQLIVDDPFVSPNHCRVERRETGWHLVDLQSENGLHLSGSGARATDVPIVHGLRVYIGRSELRFIDPEKTVPPAVPLRHSPALVRETGGRDVARAALALGGAAATCVLSGLLTYSDEEYGLPGRALSTFLACLLVILPWSGFWALLSRMSHRRSFFFSHLATAAWGFTVVTLALIAVEAVAFGFNLPDVSRDGVFACYGVVLLAVLLLHLRLASQLSETARFATALFSAALIVSSAAFVRWRMAQAYTPNLPFNDELHPPSMTFSPDDPVDKAATAVSSLMQKLDDEQ